MKTITTSGLILAILGSLVWLYYVLSPKGIDLDPYQVLGEEAAKETAKLLHSSGRLVLVRADFGAFKEGIGKTHMTIVAVEKVPISRPSMARPGIFTQPGQIAELIARYPEADAIVFFVGLAAPEARGRRSRQPERQLREPGLQTALLRAESGAGREIGGLTQGLQAMKEMLLLWLGNPGADTARTIGSVPVVRAETIGRGGKEATQQGIVLAGPEYRATTFYTGLPEKLL
jgi:hypothetical protein